jgi:hypothetical protein
VKNPWWGPVLLLVLALIVGLVWVGVATLSNKPL